MAIFTDIVNLLFPRYCAMCGERLGTQEHHLCVNCLRALPYTHSDVIAENPIEKLFWYHLPIEKAASYFFYLGVQTRSTIHSLKYFDNPTIGSYLARMMTEEYKSSGFFEGVDVIVPVPLYRRKKRKRGYNQCDYIARGISSVTGIPVETKAVSRVVDNPTQTHLNTYERKENVEGIFRLDRPELLRGRHVLIVDDVITTGSTILSLGREVVKAGEVRISVVSLGYAGEFFCNFAVDNENR